MVTAFWLAGDGDRPIPHRRQVTMIGLYTAPEAGDDDRPIYHTGGR